MPLDDTPISSGFHRYRPPTWQILRTRAARRQQILCRGGSASPPEGPATGDAIPVLTGLKGASLGPFGLRPLTPAARREGVAMVVGPSGRETGSLRRRLRDGRDLHG